MKNNLKIKIYDTFHILKRKDYLYLFISLLLFDIYAILDSSPNANIFENLIYNYNDHYYVGLLMILILLFSSIIISRYKNRIEMSTRFKNKKEYFLYIFKKAIALITFVYMINFLLIFMMRIVKDLFVFENKLYALYNVPVSLYFMWSFFKDYIYIVYTSYLIMYIDFYYNKNIITNSAIILSIVSMLIPIDAFVNNTSISLLFISSFFRYKDFLNLFNEIVYFLCSIIVKLYLISLFFYLINNAKKKSKLKYLLYKIIDSLHTVYLPLGTYIIVNIINFILTDDCSTNVALELLSIDYIKNLSYINLATKAISILCLIYIVAKLVHKELRFNSAIIFTRVSKKIWFIRKIIIYSLLFLILRAPIYLYLNFSLFCINDIFVYLYILLNLFDYFKEDNYLNLYVFFILTIIILIIRINIYSVIALLILYLIKHVVLVLTN